MFNLSVVISKFCFKKNVDCIITCVSVTLSNLAISDRSLELKYFFTSNCFSSSNIWRPVNVVRAFFFFRASCDESSDESSSWQCALTVLMPLFDDCVEFCDISKSSWFESIDFFLLNGSFWDDSVRKGRILLICKLIYILIMVQVVNRFTNTLCNSGGKI